MENEIHPTAIVSNKAKIGKGTVISPFVVIEDDVEIGENCFIGQGAGIYNGARLGNGVRVYQSASVSHRPQDLKYAGEQTYAYVGDNTVIHEFVTLHRGTVESGKTVVGANCLIMAYVHVAHDCRIGNNCILANSVQMAGHTHVEDFVTLGGLLAIHQFTRIGQHAMVGGGWRVPKDIPPYCLAGEDPLSYLGLNRIGLKRKGFTEDDLNILKDAYQILYNKSGNISQNRQKLREKYSNHKLVINVIEFAENSKRGIITAWSGLK